jgi:hypothetical protein
MGYSVVRGKPIYEKNLKLKISCQTPFKLLLMIRSISSSLTRLPSSKKDYAIWLLRGITRFKFVLSSVPIVDVKAKFSVLKDTIYRY